MKKRDIIIITFLLMTMILGGCGSNPELARFKTNFENFCTNVVTLDTSINNIDPESDNAITKLLKYINQMDEQFTAMAGLEFPEEFAYLEELADEAAEAYEKAYSGETYDEAMNEYATKNYKRAYKRLQIILIYLHGEEPTEADLVSE